jgi:stage IV sporulation protein FB
MFLAEPATSQADLHFRAFGVPVRVHPWFWIVALMLGVDPDPKHKSDPIAVLLWVAVVFVSILVHELGHAFLQRRYGGHPWITLYSFGGLASCDDCDRSPRSQILISLAGPMAGFLFAAVLLAVIRLCGHRIEFGGFSGLIGWLIPGWEPFDSFWSNLLIFDLLQVNILWGLVNLLPIYPLDGGRIARELFTLGNPRRGILQSLGLSIALAAVLAAMGLVRGSYFIAIMFGFLVYSNYQTFQAYQQYRS